MEGIVRPTQNCEKTMKKRSRATSASFLREKLCKRATEPLWYQPSSSAINIYSILCNLFPQNAVCWGPNEILSNTHTSDSEKHFVSQIHSFVQRWWKVEMDNSPSH